MQDSDSRIVFRNRPFAAQIPRMGEELFSCVPVVLDDDAHCGIKLIIGDGAAGLVWGPISPRDFIASWRATEIIRHLAVIGSGTLCYCYHAGMRSRALDMEDNVNNVISLIGREKYDEIMAMSVPEEIVAAILGRQKNEFKPDLWPITEEIRAGTIVWRPEFDDAGIQRPDQEDIERRKQEAIFAEFETSLASYAAFAGLDRGGLGMNYVSGGLLTLVDKGVEDTHEVVVALAGIFGHLAIQELAMSIMGDRFIEANRAGIMEREKTEEIRRSAKWLVSVSPPPWYAWLFGAKSRFTMKSAEALLKQLLVQYGPPNIVESAQGLAVQDVERPLELTNELLKPFIGGQLEVQNQTEGYLYRGEVAEAVIEGEGDRAELKIKFAWCAKGEDYPPIPSHWVNEKKLDYNLLTCLVSVSDIGDGRLCLNVPSIDELTILYPPDRERELDPACVEGLVWPPTALIE